MGLTFVAAITGADEAIIGHVSNIGLDGVYVRFQTNERIIDDEFVTMQIYPEDAETKCFSFQARGRVVWIDKKGVAIQFRPMTLENQNVLLEIMSLLGEQDQTRAGDRREAHHKRAS